MKSRRVGIIVSGGPAPGINAVIGAATIEAINNGMEVIGFKDGFRWLSSDEFDASDHTERLTIDRVARIHFEGGSILHTSRVSLLDDKKLQTSTRVEPDVRKVGNVVSHLALLGVGNLITIGGDDTALSARFVCDEAAGAIRLVHVPKTIDNDLPLPYDSATFGFASARYVGAQLVKNLMQDSRTTHRWYLVEAMGRKAGWLAMGIGQSAGATTILIPEEFGKSTTLQCIADVVDGAMLKRRAMGRADGVVVLAEGLSYLLGDRGEIERLMGREVPVDAAGHIRLAEVPLAYMLKQELQSRWKRRDAPMTMVTHTLGYELRSADPTPGDMAYCRSLGHGGVRMLRSKRGDVPIAAMVTLVNGNLVPVDLTTMVDPETNRTLTRTVDVDSYIYQVARAYQIRLEEGDLDNPILLAKMASLAKMTPDEFLQHYARAATRQPDRAACKEDPDKTQS